MTFADDEDTLDKYLMYPVNGGIGKTDIIVGFPGHGVPPYAVAHPKDGV